MASVFYRFSEKYYLRRRVIVASSLVVFFLAGMPLTLVHGMAEQANYGFAFSLFSSLLVFGTVGVLLFALSTSTFHRLAVEKGVYQNHKSQERVYAMVYTAAFAILSIAFLVSVYASAQ